MILDQNVRLTYLCEHLKLSGTVKSPSIANHRSYCKLCLRNLFLRLCPTAHKNQQAHWLQIS